MQRVEPNKSIYIIELEKIIPKRFEIDIYNRICKFKFINKFNRQEFQILLSGSLVFTLLDNLYQYIEFGTDRFSIPLTYSDTNLNYIILNFERNFQNNDNLSFIVSEYSSITEQFLNKIIIEFSDEDLCDFIYKIYTEFVMDIGGQVAAGYSPDFIL